MRCIQCGAEIQDTEFRCYVNTNDYCSAECCLEDLINRKYVAQCIDGAYWFDEEFYYDKRKLMYNIGEYRKVGDTTRRTTFKNERDAEEFADEVDGNCVKTNLPDFMGGKIIYVVEW